MIWKKSRFQYGKKKPSVKEQAVWSIQIFPEIALLPFMLLYAGIFLSSGNIKTIFKASPNVTFFYLFIMA